MQARQGLVQLPIALEKRSYTNNVPVGALLKRDWDSHAGTTKFKKRRLYEGIKHPWHAPGEMPVYLHKQAPCLFAAGLVSEVIINKAKPLGPAEIRE